MSPDSIAQEETSSPLVQTTEQTSMLQSSILASPAIRHTSNPTSLFDINNYPSFSRTTDQYFRTRLRIQFVAQRNRLDALGIRVIDEFEGGVVALVTQEQLRTLARLRYEPRLSDDLTRLVAAVALDMPWLAQSLDGSFARYSMGDEASRINALNALTPTQITAINTITEVDGDGDNLTDTEEGWWCTNPNLANTDGDLRNGQPLTDGQEVQELRDWLANRRDEPPTGGTPFSGWPQQLTNCVDGDKDSIPDAAENNDLGLDSNLESTDRDKFDDGQELFGSTDCCNWGSLPLNSFFSELPSWVVAPGSHPLVGAFAAPDVRVKADPQGIRVTTRTEITTTQTTTTGTEQTYGTAQTEGASTSSTEVERWDEWQENAQTIEETVVDSDTAFNPQPLPTTRGGIDSPANNPQAALPGLSQFTFSNPQAMQIVRAGCTEIEQSAEQSEGSSDTVGASVSVGADIMGVSVEAEVNYSHEWSRETSAGQSVALNSNLTDMACQSAIEKAREIDPAFAAAYPRERNRFDDVTADGQLLADSLGTLNDTLGTGFESLTGGLNGIQFAITESNQVLANQLMEMTGVLAAPKVSESSVTGRSVGGEVSTSTGNYQETTINRSQTLLSTEAWSVAKAQNTAHAADMEFTYTLQNNGTELIDEISLLRFNVYLVRPDDRDNPLLIHTYTESGTLAVNVEPGAASQEFVAGPVPLTLDELRMVDTNAAIRVELEEIDYGNDETYFIDAVDRGLTVSIDDGVNDGDITIDRYILPIYDPANETVMDVLRRFFVVEQDFDGNLTALWTPEYGFTAANAPDWCLEPINIGLQQTLCKRAVSNFGWWRIFMSGGLDYTQPIETMPAVRGEAIIFRHSRDTDLDGYSDEDEFGKGTSLSDANSYPGPVMVAGYYDHREGDTVTTTVSMQNRGLSDGFAMQALMLFPDASTSPVLETVNTGNGTTDLPRHTIGGAGRLRPGQTLVISGRVAQPTLTAYDAAVNAAPFTGGYYTGTVTRTYTFNVANCNPCSIGNGTWALNWSDGNNNGTLNFGSGYTPGTYLPVGDYGVQLAFTIGSVQTNGSFTVEATPPMTSFDGVTFIHNSFQYDINTPANYTPPVIILSYNDARGNRRYAVNNRLSNPGTALSNYAFNPSDQIGMNFQMEEDYAPGANRTTMLINNSTGVALYGGGVGVEFYTPQGVKVHQVVVNQDMVAGPNLVDINWNTADFSPAFDPDVNYAMVVHWFDREKTIIDTVSRPIKNLFASRRVGDAHVRNSDLTHDFGNIEKGNVVRHTVRLSNTGYNALVSYAASTPHIGVHLPDNNVVLEADSADYQFFVDTAFMPYGNFSYNISIPTSDPDMQSIDLTLAGTVARPAVDFNCYATPDNGATLFASMDAHALQQAIDWTTSGNVLVAGTCTGARYNASIGKTQMMVVVGKNVSIYGAYDPAALDTANAWVSRNPTNNITTFDAQNSGNHLYVRNADVYVYGIHMINGTGSRGGVLDADNSNVTFDRMNLQNNTSTSDGGVAYMTGGSLNVLNSQVGNNTAVNAGAFYTSGSTLFVNNSSINGNTATGYGGGIYTYQSDVTLQNGALGNNTAGTIGGGIRLLNSDLTTSNMWIHSNNATSGGGIHVSTNNASMPTVTIDNGSRIQLNTATIGGGISVSDSDLTITGGSQVYGNTANDDGGGIYADSSTVSIEDGALIGDPNLGDANDEGNTATNNAGGGIYAINTHLSLTNSSVIGNTAEVAGGGVSVSSPPSSGDALSMTNAIVDNNTSNSVGGGVYIIGTSSNTAAFNLNSGSISNNTSGGTGGGLYVGNYTSGNISGVAINNNNSGFAAGGVYIASTANQVTIDGNTTINDNTALSSAGGIYTVYPANISNTTISGNTSTADSGGLYLNSGGTLDNVTVENNSASSIGGGMLTYGTLTLTNSLISGNNGTRGGGIYFTGSSHTVTNTQISNNTATSDGGGVYMSRPVTFNASTISGNTANSNGGGVYVDNVNATFNNNSVLSGNFAFTGAGLFSAGLSPTIIFDNSDATANETTSTTDPDNIGGGLYSDGGTVTLRNGSVFDGNQAREGGGIFMITNTLLVDRSTLSNNSSTSSGGGIYARNATVNLIGATLDGNTAQRGGGLHTDGTNTVTVTHGGSGSFPSRINNNVTTGDGGGMFINATSSLSLGADFLVSVEIRNNVGSFGGGLYYAGNGNLGIVGVNFDGNEAGYGGAMYLGGTGTGYIATNTVLFTNNTATVHGGAVRAYNRQFDIFATRFVNNEAGQQGGAVAFADGSGTTRINSTHASFRDNSASQGGAIAFNDSSQVLHVVNTTFGGNTATSQGGAIWTVAPLTGVNFATFSGNGAPTGAQIYATAGTTEIELHNAIFVSPQSGGANCAAGSGTTFGLWESVQSDTSCSTATNIGNSSNNNMAVGTMTASGYPGITEVMPITTSSTAYQWVRTQYCNWYYPGSTPGSIGDDQLQQPRPSISGENCDSGAFEVQPAGFTPGNNLPDGIIAYAMPMPDMPLSVATTGNDLPLSAAEQAALDAEAAHNAAHATDETTPAIITEAYMHEPVVIEPFVLQANAEPASTLSNEIALAPTSAIESPQAAIVTGNIAYLPLTAQSYSSFEMTLEIRPAPNSGGLYDVSVDIADDGTLEALYAQATADGNEQPHIITIDGSALKTQLNIYMQGKSGLVAVPVRLFNNQSSRVRVLSYHAVPMTPATTDLVVTNMTMTPNNNVTSGDDVTVQITAQNNGALATGPVTVMAYVDHPETGPTYIGSIFLENLAPNGGNATQSFAWETLGISGTLPAYAIVNPFSVIAETNYPNNRYSYGNFVVLSLPDLLVDDVTFSQFGLQVGEQTQTIVTVRNAGDNPAGAFTLKAYDGDPTNGGVEVGSANLGGLAANAAQDMSITWTPQTVGSGRVYFVVDSANVISESDSANNTASRPVFVGLGGPIEIDSGNPSETAYNANDGYGYLNGQVSDFCGTTPDETYRFNSQSENGNVSVDYQFDNLAPGRRYHVDLTFFICDGQQHIQNVLIDGNLAQENITIENNTRLKLSVLVDPAFYSDDNSIVVQIVDTGGTTAFVNAIDMSDVDYRYADSGGADDPSYASMSGTVRPFGWLNGVSNTNFGTQPFQSRRLNGGGNNVRYQYDALHSGTFYAINATFYQASGSSNHAIYVDGTDTGARATLSGNQRVDITVLVPQAAYNDGTIVVEARRLDSGLNAFINEIALQEVTHLDLPAIREDINDDGVVAPLDAIYVINRIGTNDALADIDGNGTVENADAQAVLNALGTGLPQSAPPQSAPPQENIEPPAAQPESEGPDDAPIPDDEPGMPQVDEENVDIPDGGIND